MKRFVTICIMLAQVAAFAADRNVELLCVWNYKTLYKIPSGEEQPNVAFSEENTYYFFSDNSFVKAGAMMSYDDVLKVKAVSPKRWMAIDNYLILLDKRGRQEKCFVTKENQMAISLLKGEKEITQVVTLNSETVSSPYNDVLAFFPR